METAILITSVVVAAISAVFAWRAVGEAVKQNELSRKAVQAQTFLIMVNNAREIQFSKGMDIIRSLNYSDYRKFKSKESKEAQEQIRAVVDFLNDLMHLIENGYITKEQVRAIYFISIRTCAEQLQTWWVKGFREEMGSEFYYLSFEKLCAEIQL